MRYCLNISGLSPLSLRLQKNFSWVHCEKKEILQENDFTTVDEDIIINLQEIEYKFTWDGKDYVINSEMGIMPFEDNIAFYQTYCFINKYPEPPKRSQLESVLLNGDDSVDNILILKTNGLFDLIQPEKLTPYKLHPNIVFRNECFNYGTGYVGSIINDENFENYVMDIFRTHLYFWKMYLQTKKTNFQYDRIKGNDLDDLLDIYKELENIKKLYT